MPRIQWSDTYTIFDEELDQHHKQLIRYLAVLESPEHRDPADPEFVTMIVDGLVDYAGYHFAAEEAKMLALGYPDTVAHQAEHADFRKDVLIFREDFGKGSPGMDRMLVGYLKDWILAHILASDRRFGEWSLTHRAPPPA